MVSASLLLFSPAEAAREETTRATAAAAATRVARTVGTARTPLSLRYGGVFLEPQYIRDWRFAAFARPMIPVDVCDAAIRGRPQLRNLLKIRFERHQEASGFAARHDAMVEGER